MNLLLLDESDYIAPGLVRIAGRRHRQLLEVIKAEPGKSCKAGMLNGLTGTAELLEIGADAATLRPDLTVPPPEPSPVTLIAALPRPKTFQKVLHAAVTMGVKEFWFIACWKVDKSYWSSPNLETASLDETCRLALEQAGDTVMPRIEFRNRFKPFVEDELPGILAGRPAYAGHPAATEPIPVGIRGPAALVIGPEGGFTGYEIDLLVRHGVTPVTLGRRTLRTEVAVPALLATLTAQPR